MTFEFSVFVGTDFFQQDRLDIGDEFTLPTSASARLAVSDDDAFLSGDIGRNGRSDDTSGQTAVVTSSDGSQSESVGRVSIERVYVVVDASGNEYTLIEIDVESRGGPDNNDYYAFSGLQPPAGASLSVTEIGQAAISEVPISDLAADNSSTIIRLEAEDLDLSGYRTQGNDAASGEELIRLRGSSEVGTAETQFAGVDGTYDISVDHIDESDGQGTIELLVDGEVVGMFTLDADNGGNGAANNTINTHVFEGIELSQGQTVTFRGTRDGFEFARIDAVTFEREPIVLNDGLIRLEAEDLDLSGYRVDDNAAASGGDVIRLTSNVGTAETEFSGAGGNFDISVDFIDENDGQGTIELLVDGVIIDSITLDADNGGNGVANTTINTHVFEGVELDDGQTVTFRGTRDQGEFARIDTVTFDRQPEPMPIDGPLRIEAEDLDLSGYRVQGNDAASGEELIRLRGSSEVGTAETQFAGADGTYDISVDHIDESDGQGTIELLVDGVVIGAFNLDADDGGNGSANNTINTHVFEGVELSQGQTVTFRGTRDGFEFARIDAVTFEQSSDNVNSAPEAQALLISGDEDTTISGTLAATDVDGDPLAFSLATDLTSGTVAVNADGTFDYTPDADFNGTDSFTYSVDDGNGGSATETVTVEVNAVNDDPTVSGALAAVASEDDAALTIDLLDGASDVDSSDELSIANVTGLVAGVTLDGTTLNVDPTDDSFQSLAEGNDQEIIVNYDIVDGNGGSVAQTATITINGANDAPMIDERTQNTSADRTSGILLTALGSDVDTDDDGTTLTYSITGQPSFGTAEIVAGALNLNRGTDFEDLAVGEIRTVMVEVTATDSNGAMGSGEITFNVSGVNDDPTVSGALTATASEDDDVFTIDLLDGASDVDGDSLGIANLTVLSGDASGVTINDTSLDVDPSAYNNLALNESEVIEYSYDVEDGNGGSVTQTAAITIIGSNDAPTINPPLSGVDRRVNGLEDTNATIGFSLPRFASEVDNNDTLTFEITGQDPALGNPIFIDANQNLFLAPGNDFNFLSEDEQFDIVAEVTVTDSQGAATAGDFIFRIFGENDDPIVASALTATASEDDASFNVDLLDGASDVDASDTLNVVGLTLVSGDDSGVTINGNDIDVDPSAYNGLAVGESEVITYSYDIEDGNGGSVSQTATFTINGTNNLAGTDQADTLIGDEFDNVLIGGEGDDTLIGNEGDDILDGGDGIDTVDFSAELGAMGVRVNLGNPIDSGSPINVEDTFGDEDILVGIENVIATDNNDRVTGSESDNYVELRDGTDSYSYEVGGGNDFADGGTGSDTLWIVNGLRLRNIEVSSLSNTPETFDVSVLDSATDMIDSSASAIDTDDIVVTVGSGGSVTADAFGRIAFQLGRAGDAVNIAGDFSNTAVTNIRVTSNFGDELVDASMLSGFNGTSSVSVSFSGNGGDDTFRSGAGNDFFDGNPGFVGGTVGIEPNGDTADYAHATGSLIIDLAISVRNADATAAGLGIDSLVDVENIIGGSADDEILGSNDNNALDGGAGDDVLAGRNGNDTLTGGTGADTFVFASGDGMDTITDFEDGVDLVDVQQFGLSSADIQQVIDAGAQAGNDIELDFGNGDLLVFRDTDQSLLASDDFIV